MFCSKFTQKFTLGNFFYGTRLRRSHLQSRRKQLFKEVVDGNRSFLQALLYENDMIKK